MAEELGWTTEGFLEVFREVLDQGLAMADLDSRVVFIPNAIKYNKPQSPNVIKSWASHWDEIPECKLKNLAYEKLKAFIEGFGEGFIAAFVKAIHKPISKAMANQEQEQEQEQKQERVSSRREDIPTTDIQDKIKNQNSCPHKEIIALYHEILPMCPLVRSWGSPRRSYLKSRWREEPARQNLGWWRGFFEHVKKSDFLIGNVPGRDGNDPFLADLEWLIRPSKFARVIEGKYHKVQPC
ncbi:MAG: hypothetical protein P4M14_06405 [Gammaproteobacteria bacterium]|nr:hypothetical protein [Gammaproteobacteria bacterium]